MDVLAFWRPASAKQNLIDRRKKQNKTKKKPVNKCFAVPFYEQLYRKVDNKIPFYSCVFGCLAFEWKWG